MAKPTRLTSSSPTDSSSMCDDVDVDDDLPSGLKSTSAVELNKMCFSNTGGNAADDKSGLSVNNGEHSAFQPNLKNEDLSTSTSSTTTNDSTTTNNSTPTNGTDTETNNLFISTKESRVGRDLQRYDNKIRLITGCVPIVKGGGVLLCGATKKKEWIIPKGGWETDETIEVGAQRETYEEAGVYGTLGPPLSSITFNTRKGGGNSHSHSGALEKAVLPSSSPISNSSSENFISDSEVPNENDVLTPIDIITSTPSTPSTTTTTMTPSASVSVRVCRAIIFPLYVHTVLSDWPESSRARRVVSIDEAIDIVKRPELKAFLEQVKERGLHLVSPEAENETETEIEGGVDRR